MQGLQNSCSGQELENGISWKRSTVLIISVITACVVYELKLICIRKHIHTEKFGINNNINSFIIYS
jgi:hypothetical protein